MRALRCLPIFLVGALLGLSACTQPPVVEFPEDDPIHLVPAGPVVLLRFDVRDFTLPAWQERVLQAQYAGTELGTKILEQITASSEPIDSTAVAAVYLEEPPTGAPPNRLLLVLEPPRTFDVANWIDGIESQFEGADIRKGEIAGRESIAVHFPEAGQTHYVVAEDGRLIVGTTPEIVERALAMPSSGPAAHEEGFVRRNLPDIDRSRQIWLLVDTERIADSMGLPRDLSRILGSGEFGERLEFEAKIEFADQNKAAATAQQAQGLLTMARMSVPAEMPALPKLLSGITIDQQGKTMTAEISIDGEDYAEFALQALEQLKQQQAAADAPAGHEAAPLDAAP